MKSWARAAAHEPGPEPKKEMALPPRLSRPPDKKDPIRPYESDNVALAPLPVPVVCFLDHEIDGSINAQLHANKALLVS